MTYLCCYDISSTKIRVKIAKYMEKHSLRIQKSVFVVESVQNEHLEIYNYVQSLLDPKDSFYLIPICKGCQNENLHQGPEPFRLSARYMIL